LLVKNAWLVCRYFVDLPYYTSLNYITPACFVSLRRRPLLLFWGFGNSRRASKAVEDRKALRDECNMSQVRKRDRLEMDGVCRINEYHTM